MLQEICVIKILIKNASPLVLKEVNLEILQKLLCLLLRFLQIRSQFDNLDASSKVRQSSYSFNFYLKTICEIRLHVQWNLTYPNF